MFRIIAVIVGILIYTKIFAQIDHTKAGETVLIIATIKNEIGEPVAVETRFVDLINKPVIARSADDGTLRTVLKQGTNYYTIFKNYIEIGGITQFQTPLVGKYTEISKMFLVRPIKEKMEFHKLLLFQPKDTTLTTEGIEFLKFFKEFYALNKNLQFKMILSAQEMNFKDIKQTKTEVSNNKKKQIKFVITAKEQIQKFLEARSNVLVAKLKELNLPAKIFEFEYNTDLPHQKTSKKKSAVTNLENNAIIIIDKVLNL